MSKPELYLIKLFRKAIHKPDMEYPGDEGCRDERKSDGEPYLAMDYFDALIPEEMSLEKEINTFMDVYSPDKKMSRYDIAMQSIPIYCSANDVEKYSKQIDVRIKESARDKTETVELYCNPFKESRQPYLSLIQIYISPEIMARIAPTEVDVQDGRNSDGEIKNKVTRTIIDQFYEDIHKIIEGYAIEHYQRDRFNCRVYRSLSAGDFTVAVRSNRPETPFMLATLFRERGCCYEGYENENKKNLRFIFYKTYTLLSCNRMMISGDSEEADIGNEKGKQWNVGSDEFNLKGKFVLRVAFNSKYWAEAARKNSRHNYPRLTGRYDFSIELSEKWFRYLSDVLCDYKFGKEDIGEQYSGDDLSEKWFEYLSGVISAHRTEKNCSVRKQNSGRLLERWLRYLSDLFSGCKEGISPEEKSYDVELSEENQEDLCKCAELIDYIDLQHVAYINERYSFVCNDMDVFPGEENERFKTSICLSKETQGRRFISSVNEESIGIVEQKLDRVRALAVSLDTSRQNIMYYLNLLHRMLDLCSSINGLSDTRIYCSILIHQIDLVLDGVEDFYLTLKAEQNRYLIEVMERAFVEAVESLNTYAKLIRDNNLQSLQTPNYNLETSVGIEKFLVGYGELLHSLFKWYERTRVCEEIYGLRQQFTPFMIPGQLEESFSTKVLFKEVKAEMSNERLMVVWCSAFSDLTNFGGTVGILFHEVAHNLRYKGRSERNRIILRYCTYLICDQIAISIVDFLEQSIPGLMDSVGLIRLICDSLYEAYDKVVYRARGIQYKIRDYSYVSITDFIKNEYSKYTKAVQQIGDIDKFIRRCVSLRAEQKSTKRDEALSKVKELREVLVNNTNISFKQEERSGYGQADYEDLNFLAEDPLAKLIEEAKDALEAYIRETKNSGLRRDIAAETIYNSLNANSSLGDEFRKMLPRYGLVDRFFYFLAERLNTKVKELEYSSSGTKECVSGYCDVSEAWKMMRFLTQNRSRSYVEPSILSAYVSPHIVRTQMEAVDIMNRATYLYSEVTSDLFMYNLMEMTPYGYFSFMSEYVSIDARMPHTFVRRFCTVMYAAFSAPIKGLDDAELKKRYWFGFVERLYYDFVQSVVKSLDTMYEESLEFKEYIVPTRDGKRKPLHVWFSEIRNATARYSEKYFEQHHIDADVFDELNADYEDGIGESAFLKIDIGAYKGHGRDNNIRTKGNGILSLDTILDQYSWYFTFLRSLIKKIYTIISDSILNEKNRGKLRTLEILQDGVSRCEFMSSFLRRIYLEIAEEVVTIERLRFLADDYRDGYKNTSRLHDELIGKSSDEKDEQRWMWSYFNEVKSLLNNPEIRTNRQVRQKANESMIEMIFELYYRAIRESVSDLYKK